jgi:opacity protein-like surface antigen
MIKICFSVFVVLSLSLTVMAQDTPRAEVFAGYSYAGNGSNGFDVSIAGNLNNWLGLVADVGGQYTRLDDQGFTEKIRTHSILFGPRFSLRRGRVVPFAHVLVGFSHLSTKTNEFGAPLSFSDSSWGLALGGGLDIKINDKFAIRALQVDYLRTHFFNETQTKGRISVGVVFRFGRRGK